MRTSIRILGLAAATLVTAGTLAGCATSSGGGTDSAAAGFPLTFQNPWGEAVIDEKPQRVAVVDSVDLDIALALGVEPVISSVYGDYPLDPWTLDQLEELGIDELPTFDATDGTDFEAVAAADPDVILATSGWTLEDDYDKLAQIAPVVAWGPDQELTDLTWSDRTLLAGQALGLEDEAQAVVDEVTADFAAVAEAHPAWAGKTLTYSVMHPGGISYITYKGSDVTFFTDLGFTLPPQAADYTGDDNTVSVENIDALEADVLLVGYPFGDEGILTQDALESNALFQKLAVVEKGGYGILGDDVASPLAYPTPLSQTWVLGQITPLLEQVAG